jgi:hypothetical protein
MAHKKKHGAPVPPANQPHIGPAGAAHDHEQAQPGGGAPFQDQDQKRRLGGYETAGEHSRQQPIELNDGNRHSK